MFSDKGFTGNETGESIGRTLKYTNLKHTIMIRQNRLFKTVILFLFTGIILAGCSQDYSKKYYQSIPQGFDELCQRAIDEWKVPGMAVAVVKDGKVVFLKGFGMAALPDSLNEGVPVTEKTKFVIASTSKAFTSALLANVMDEHKEIKWDAPVVDYLPDFKLYDPWVTKNFQVRDIMVHRTGFKPYALDDLPFFGYDRDELYALFGAVQPSYSFRSTYAYNNEMFTVAAKIIEKYTGKSWDEAIAERIFAPLEMKNSTTGNVSFYTAENLAQGYRMTRAKDKEEIVVYPRTDKEDAFTWLSAVSPAGFVISTAEDMANWLIMHLNHGTFNGKQIVSRENHDMLFYPQTIESCDSSRLCNYAQGWTIEQNNRGRYIRHTGLAYGYTALVGLVPNLDMGFVFLTNNGSTTDPQAAIARDLIEMYYGNDKSTNFDDYFTEYKKSLFAERERRPQEEQEPVAALRNSAYTGNYHLDIFGTAKVYERNDSLFFKLKDVDSYLEHKNGNVFSFGVPGAGRFELTFKTKGNRVDALTFDINDPIGDFKKR